MPEPGQFADFLRRVRAGDEQAAVELVREYEPLIRRTIRFRMRDPRMQRLVDSMDICQSVLGSFFIRAVSGQYDLDQPEDLVKLLVGIARNKVAAQARRQNRQRRDQRRQADVPEALDLAPDPDPRPSRYIAGKELLKEFQQRLDPEERQLADLRTQGVEWAAIAEQLGGTAQGRRKQLARAVERIAQVLGLEETAD